MSVKVLVPVKFSQRKPLFGDRYPVRTYAGMLLVKRWVPAKGIFTKIEESSIDVWFDEIEFPTGDDLVEIAKEDIPRETHPERRNLLVQGMLALSRVFDEILRSKGG